MTPEETHRALVAVGTTAVGILIGWGANALTLSGRVAAIEAAQARMERMVYTLVQRELPPVARELLPPPPPPTGR